MKGWIPAKDCGNDDMKMDTRMTYYLLWIGPQVVGIDNNMFP